MRKEINKLSDYKLGWVVRNGNLLFIFFFVILLVASSFIYYTEKKEITVVFYHDVMISDTGFVLVKIPESLSENIRRGEEVILTLKDSITDDPIRITGLVKTVSKKNNGEYSDMVIHLTNPNRLPPVLPDSVQHGITATACFISDKQTLAELIWEGTKKMLVDSKIK